jgi:hypothetical protein
MSAGKNIAIGCGVIVLAIMGAGFMGYRWVMKNYQPTVDPAEIQVRCEQVLGTLPPDDYLGTGSIYTSPERLEVVLNFTKLIERGNEISLTIFNRLGQHDIDSVLASESELEEGIDIRFDLGEGDVENYTASWGQQTVPVRLSEGFDDGILKRKIISVLQFQEFAVALYFDGSPDELDREAVQEMVDRIPEGWQPLPLNQVSPSATPGE